MGETCRSGQRNASFTSLFRPSQNLNQVQSSMGVRLSYLDLPDVKCLPFGRFSLVNFGTNFTHLEDPGIAME